MQADINELHKILNDKKSLSMEHNNHYKRYYKSLYDFNSIISLEKNNYNFTQDEFVKLIKNQNNLSIEQIKKLITINAIDWENKNENILKIIIANNKLDYSSQFLNWILSNLNFDQCEYYLTMFFEFNFPNFKFNDESH